MIKEHTIWNEKFRSNNLDEFVATEELKGKLNKYIESNERIIEPLQSRCTKFKLEPPSRKDVAIHVADILKKEKIKYKAEDIATIIQHYYPDIRSVINSLQSCSLGGTLVLSDKLSANYKE